MAKARNKPGTLKLSLKMDIAKIEKIILISWLRETKRGKGFRSLVAVIIFPKNVVRDSVIINKHEKISAKNSKGSSYTLYAINFDKISIKRTKKIIRVDLIFSKYLKYALDFRLFLLPNDFEKYLRNVLSTPKSVKEIMIVTIERAKE